MNPQLPTLKTCLAMADEIVALRAEKTELVQALSIVLAPHSKTEIADCLPLKLAAGILKKHKPSTLSEI